MLWTSSPGSPTRPAIVGYGVAVLSVAAGMSILALMQAQWRTAAPVSLFLFAVAISTCVGGKRPGVLATALSIPALACFFWAAPSLPLGTAQMLRVALFTVVASILIAAVVAAQRSAAERSQRASGEPHRNDQALRAEAALQESQRLLQLVLATMPVGVVVTDRAGDIILTNAASKRIWGDIVIVSGRERWARSKGFWHVSGERIAPADWASVRALSQGQTSVNELIDIETYAGERKTIQNSAAPIRNAEGLIVGAVIVNEDVTERVRAAEALRESADRLHHLSRRLLEVQEEERRHLARELHDEFGQLLATVSLQVHAARRVAAAAAQPALGECMELLQRAGEQVRSLALELRPAMLETAGLDATLRWLAEQHQQRTGIATQVVGDLNGVAGAVAIACFRVVQEALTNVARHARARHVRIELSRSDNALELAVRDDGLGFDVARTLKEAASRGHLGLLGMQERVQILGGSLKVDSQPGHGTRLRVSLPQVEAPAKPQGPAE